MSKTPKSFIAVAEAHPLPPVGGMALWWLLLGSFGITAIVLIPLNLDVISDALLLLLVPWLTAMLCLLWQVNRRAKFSRRIFTDPELLQFRGYTHLQTRVRILQYAEGRWQGFCCSLCGQDADSVSSLNGTSRYQSTRSDFARSTLLHFLALRLGWRRWKSSNEKLLRAIAFGSRLELSKELEQRLETYSAHMGRGFARYIVPILRKLVELADERAPRNLL